MLIRIVKWDDYNVRKDVKHSTWFRCQNNFLTRMFAFSPIEKLVWIGLLGDASIKQSAAIRVDIGLYAALLQCPADDIVSALNKFKDSEMIEIPTSRRRNVSVTSASRERHVHVPLQTDRQTDKTNRTNRTDRQTNTGAPAPENARTHVDPFPAERQVPEVQRVKKLKAVPEKTDGSKVWEAYEAAYMARYGTPPARNAKANSLCAQLVKRLGVGDATALVGFYLTHSKRWYVEKCHMLDCAVGDAEALLTQMRSGVRLSAQSAVQEDLNQHNNQAIAAAMKLTGWDKK